MLIFKLLQKKLLVFVKIIAQNNQIKQKIVLIILTTVLFFVMCNKDVQGRAGKLFCWEYNGKKNIVKVAHAIHDFKSVMKLYILYLSL